MSINISQLNLDDPLIFEWTLRKIGFTHRFNKTRAIEIEEQLFSNSTRKELQNLNEIELKLMLATVSTEKFSESLNFLISKWPEWGEELADLSGEVIVRISPKEAYTLFSSQLEILDLSKEKFKFFTILSNIIHLEDEKKKDIANKILEKYIRTEDSEKTIFITLILNTAWQYDHPEFYNILFNYFTDPDSKRIECKIIFLFLYKVLFNSLSIFDFIFEYYHSYTEQNFQILSPFLKPLIPIEDLNKALDNLKEDKFEHTISFFEKYLNLISSEKIKNLIIKIIKEEAFLDRINQQEDSYYFYIFILAVIVNSIKLEKIDIHGLELHQVLEIISANIEDISSLENSISFLKEQNRENVITGLIDKLNENIDNYGGYRVAEIMGELAYDEFIEPLLKILTEECDIIYAAEKALVKYGNRIMDRVNKDLNKMDQYTCYGVLLIIEQLDEEKQIEEFIDTHFDYIFLNNKAKLMELMEMYPREKFIKKLEPYINKGQDLVDETYLILNKLFGYNQENPETQGKNYYTRGKNSDELNNDTINIELKCKNCGDESFYRVKEAILYFPDMTAEVKESHNCINCNKFTKFDITRDGYSIINNLLAKMEQSPEKSNLPLKIIADKEKTTDYIIDRAIEEISYDPSNPEKYMHLANIYHKNNMTEKAVETYKEVININPSYIEAYYNLADIEAREENFIESFKWLDKGRKYLNIGKYIDKDVEDPEFIKYYNKLYELMAEASQRNYTSKEKIPHRVQSKIGRNDLCPCGSKKKYKKCCM